MYILGYRVGLTAHSFVFMLLLLLILIGCSNENENTDSIDGTDPGSDANSSDSDSAPGSDANSSDNGSDPIDAVSKYDSATLTYGKVAPDHFPALSEDWRIPGIESLMCLLWNYDSETRILVVDWINRSATSTPLNWQIMLEDSETVTSFVIYKDDPNCSENRGYFYNWRIEAKLNDTANGGKFDVSTRNCASSDFEAAKTATVSPMDTPRGAICNYIDRFTMFPMYTSGCGTQEGFCRTDNNMDFVQECTVSDPVCEAGLACYSDRCLSPCNTIGDCADESIYDCQDNVCVLR
ncbi:MAG: hypothetical protein M0R76_12780 [Proteobacteria bacterium]|nr:hypothetical protein [Pseudomonadota bacterium]